MTYMKALQIEIEGEEMLQLLVKELGNYQVSVQNIILLD